MVVFALLFLFTATLAVFSCSNDKNKTNLESLEDYDNPLMNKRIQAKLRNGATKSNESAEKTPDQHEKSLNSTLSSTYDKKESARIYAKNTKYLPVSRYISS